MRIAILVFLMTHTSTYYCPLTQRYDVGQFPPRCLDCPRVISNSVSLSQISTVLRTKRAPKFSPGLPQNQTCGCWRANQTVDVALNASWVVSGLIFNSNKGRWLREIGIQASADNVSFIDWGSYTATNFTDASLTIFSLPIRAQFFRLTILRYANHFINITTGFPLSVQALVSQTQPFDCGCPTLSTGACCPFQNMTIRNDTCIWCMDPTSIATVMVDGCGRCRQGTFEFQGRCIYNKAIGPINNMVISNPTSDGVFWTTGLNVTQDTARTALILYLSNSSDSFIHPCTVKNASATCLKPGLKIFQGVMYNPPIQRLEPPLVSTQYLQFDRGRYTLNMTQQTIRTWAACSSTMCTGSISALFVTPLSGSFSAQHVFQPLKFNFGLPGFMSTVGGTQDTSLARMELHCFFGSTWALRIIGLQMRGDQIFVQWDTLQSESHTNQGEFTQINAPPAQWAILRVTDGLNGTVLVTQQPVKVVNHYSVTTTQYNGIDVLMTYGLNFNPTPTPGDSEQIIFITAKSPQPIRLKRLSVTTPINGLSVTYTNSKGFIVDPTRVLDLTIACTQMTFQALETWIQQAILILPQNMQVVEDFIKLSCFTSKSTAKAYWMVPSRPLTPRNQALQMQVIAEFA